MSKGAPNRKDLDYFPKTVDFYEDDKIFDLLEKYGPLGVTVYDCILVIVYSNGYYADLSKDKLSRMIIRKIGNKWVKGQRVVVQVIDYCADLGLIDKGLLQRNIITSVGIQKRYYKVAVKLMKRRLYSKEFWLLDETGEPFLNAPSSRITSEENRIVSEENGQTSEVIPIKEKETKLKENKNHRPSAYAADPRLDQAIADFVDFRRKIRKPMTDRAVELMMHKLEELSADPAEQAEILNQSIRNGWTGVYPLKDHEKQEGAAPVKPKQNQFHNFHQRDTDYDALVMDQLKERLKKEGENTDG